MTAHRILLLTAGTALAVSFTSTMAAADAAKPIPLGSLRSVEKVESLFLVPPGTAPVAAVPPIVTVAQPPAFRATPVPGMPRDGGTNLEGLLRDPRASRVTPAGLRLADPGWMRKPPAERR
jgi:hypothetical protein